MPLSGMPFRSSNRRHLDLVAAAVIVDHLGALAAIACLKIIIIIIISEDHVGVAAGTLYSVLVRVCVRAG